MSLVVQDSESVSLQRGYLALCFTALDELCYRLVANCVEKGLFPETWMANQARRDGFIEPMETSVNTETRKHFRYHVTLCLPKELKTVHSNNKEKGDQKKWIQDFSNAMVGHGVFCSGVGVTKRCAFVVLCIPRAATLRRQYGLPCKDFHVTLGFDNDGDDHSVAKSIDAVCEPFVYSNDDLQQYWLEIARNNFQLLRKQQPADFDLMGLLELCRAVVSNLTSPTMDGIQNDLMESWGLLWCRVAGLAEEYEVVVQAANKILAVRPQDAPALGYKGYAQFRMFQYDQALLNLEQSHTSFASSLKNNNKNNNAKHERQAKQVEDCLVRCCHVLGRQLPAPPLIKFPRTAHVFRPTDSKAVTDDDQVLPRDSAMMSLMTQHTVLLQEKIDGSNLGLSLSFDGQDILIQNRSHYLHSGEHPQYGPLTSWIRLHREALLQILKSEEKRSSRHGLILYGEWMVARHSIPYHHLPSYFIAFDLYDISQGRFYSQRRLHQILRGTGIPVVPTVGEHMFDPSAGSIDTQLLPFLETKSKFRSDGGPVEGIVFRIEDDDWLSYRGKLVRPDFVAGITDHWALRSIEKQTLTFSDDYLRDCYDLAPPMTTELPAFVKQTRTRYMVVYKRDSAHPPGVLPETPTLTSSPLAVKMPRNLSWLWPNEVAVSSTPKTPEQIRAFYDAMGVRLVITLTQEQPIWDRMFFEECRNIFVPVPNYCPPTIDQMENIGDTIVRRIATGEAVLEHCGGGKGRAGTVAACLLLRFGTQGIRARVENEGGALFPRAPFMTSDEAIREIRRIRPESIETELQEEFVKQYAEHLWRKYTEHDDIMGDTNLLI